MKSEPQEEHAWLQRLVGEWTYETECALAPDQPPTKMTGSESVRSLRGLWTIGEGSGNTPDGTPMTSIMTLGFDPARKRFVGTFVASMMSHLWVYDGAVDKARDALVLDAEGPDFTQPGRTAKYQDIITFKSPDHRVLTSQAIGPDGKWHQFMEMHYRRRA